MLTEGDDVAVIANGMMLSTALATSDVLREVGVGARVVNVPVVKPLDVETVLAAVRGTRATVTAENHTVIGGLGSAVAESIAEAGLARPLRRVGLLDTFAEGSRKAPPLFQKYHLGVQDIVSQVWSVLGRDDAMPDIRSLAVDDGEYAPV